METTSIYVMVVGRSAYGRVGEIVTLDKEVASTEVRDGRAHYLHAAPPNTQGSYGPPETK